MSQRTLCKVSLCAGVLTHRLKPIVVGHYTGGQVTRHDPRPGWGCENPQLRRFGGGYPSQVILDHAQVTAWECEKGRTPPDEPRQRVWSRCRESVPPVSSSCSQQLEPISKLGARCR